MITTIKNSNYLLANNQLTFLDSRFYRTEVGGYVPSVTTILNAYPKGAAFYEWLKKNGENSDEIRDEAGRRGSTVHDLTERYDSGEEISLMDESGFIAYKLSEWAMFEKYVEFRKRFPFDIIHNEQNFISEKLGFAGTVDRIVEMFGQKILIDIKTSNYIGSEFWLQLAAYNQLLKEQGITTERRGLLWLNAKTRTEGKGSNVQGIGYQLIFRDESEWDKDWRLFQATATLWRAENSDMKPRQLTYQLTHKL